MARIIREEFTSSGSWTCPAGVTKIMLMACGGGGGGEAGNTIIDCGGGGSNMVFHCVDVVPNTTYTVTIGAGGAGGIHNSTASQDGGDTTFGALVTWSGGFGGANDGCGQGATTSGGTADYAGHSGQNQDDANNEFFGFQGGAHVGGFTKASAGGGGAGGRGDGGDSGWSGNGYTGISAAANTGAGGGGGWTGYDGGAGGSGYLEIIWSE